MNMLTTISMVMAKTAEQGTKAGTITSMIFMVAIWMGVMYLFLFRPQKKHQKEMDELKNSVKAGDNIMTTSGFFGVVLDVVDDETIIVEFGNNKNCRIPMHKNAIAEVEKQEDAEE